MKRISVHLSDQQRERLSRLSDHNGLKVAELIRRAIDTYLDTEEAKIESREAQLVGK
jgi:predicted DNA-binding protein